MKGRPFLPSLVVALFATAFWLSTNRQSEELPQPTDVANEQTEGEEHYRARELYYEQMHRAPEGVNWRDIEMQNQMELNLLRAKMPRERANDTIAGTIIGSWEEVGSQNQAGRVLFADYNPTTQEVYAAADGGSIWKGNVNGTNWQVLTHDFEIPNVHYLRNYQLTGKSRLVVAARINQTHGFFYKDSNDPVWRNPTGTAYNTIKSKGSVFQCVANPSTIYLLASDSTELALYASTDFGLTFERIVKLPTSTYGGSAQMDIWTDEENEGDLYLIAKNKAYKLVGQQMVLQGNILAPAPTKENLCGATINGTTYLYAHCQVNNENRFYASEDGGLTWGYKGVQTDNMFMQNSFNCSAKTPNLLYWGAVDLYRSTNAGTNWTKISTWYEYYDAPETKLHADLPCINSFMQGNTEHLFVSTDGGIFKSTDGGNNFQNITLSGLRNAQYYDTYTHPTLTNYVWAGSQDQGFQRSDVGGTGLRDFDQLISGDYGHIKSGNGGNSLWSVYPGFAMYYQSYTQTSYTRKWDFNMTGNLWLPPIMVKNGSPATAYMAGGRQSGSGHYIYKLDYAGGNIQSTQGSHNFQAAVTALAYSPLQPNYHYAVNTAGAFFVSADNGNTWTKSITGLPNEHYFYGNAILPSPALPDRIWIGGSGYQGGSVWMSDNKGASFQKMSDGLPLTLVYDLACTPGEGLIFAATEAGPYVYKAADQKWYYMGGTAAPVDTYWSVEYVEALKTVRFGTYGRGIWDFKLDISSLTPNDLAENNTKISVYPNPTADFLNIEIPFTKGAYSLLNSAGQKVLGDCLENGSSRMDLSGLPAGVYVLQLFDERKQLIRTEKVMKK